MKGGTFLVVRIEYIKSRAYLRGPATAGVKLTPHSALKEFFEPLRMNDSHADLFVVYRKQSIKFDRGYMGEYRRM